VGMLRDWDVRRDPVCVFMGVMQTHPK